MRDDLNSLYVKPGDLIRAQDHNRMADAIARRHLRGGKGVRLRQLDTHCVIEYLPPKVVRDYPFRITAHVLDRDKTGLTFRRGLVNGIEPQVLGVAMSEADPLELSGFDPETGDLLVYLQVRLNLDTWKVDQAEIVTMASPPTSKAFHAWKLLAICNADGSVDPRAFRDFALFTSNRRTSGYFTPWWTAL